ncbi:MAG: hypothetical protein ABMA15_27595, partial [Vicinamibacterales bacterium]
QEASLFQCRAAAAGVCLRITGVHAVRNETTSSLMINGNHATGWGDYPQRPEDYTTMWRISELTVHGPVSQ